MLRTPPKTRITKIEEELLHGRPRQGKSIVAGTAMSASEHNALAGLQPLSAGWYHLTLSDYNALTDAHAQLGNLQTDKSPTFSGVTLGTLAGMLKATAGVVSAATGDTDYQVALTFPQSVARTVNAIALSGDSAAPGNSKLYGTDGAGAKGWYDLAAAVAHALLSATHTDTLAAAVARGSLVVGNVTPAWAALAHPGAANRVLQSSALDTAWSGFALAIEAASAINQDLTTDAVAIFAGVSTPNYLGDGAAGDFLQDPAFTGYTQTAAAQRIRLGYQPGTQYTIGRNMYTGYLEFIGSQTGYIGYTFNGPVIPSAADASDLGDTTHEFRGLYIGTNGIYIGTGQEFRIYKSGTELIIG